MKPSEKGYLIELKLALSSLNGESLEISATGSTKNQKERAIGFTKTSTENFKLNSETQLTVEKKPNASSSLLVTHLLVPYSLIRYGNTELYLSLDFRGNSQKSKKTVKKTIWIPRSPPKFDPHNPRKRLRNDN